jgi:glucosamine--fructose-6-phosphate aminotransferase (isomerizing)
MCAIVGYVGSQSALDVVLAGLRRLEHRGCDAAGVAVLADGGLAAAKKAGDLTGLERELTDRPLPTGSAGIGHTRRATLGAATDVNADPQLDASGRVAVVHTGTIDNFAELRAEMAGHGHRLASETDTEPVAHLLAEEFSASGDLPDAMRRVSARLEGTFTVVALHADAPDVLVGARRGLPLLAAVGDGEGYLVSAAEALPDTAAPVWCTVQPPGPDVLVLRRAGDELRCEVLAS